MELLDDIADALKRDQNLEFSDLRGLINAFRRVDPAKIKMYTVPVVSVDEGGTSVLVPDQAASEPLFSGLRTFAIPDVALPATAAPAEVHMAVENGTGANDRGDEVVYAFTAHGYDVVGPTTEADGSDYDETQVLWRRGKDAEGVAVASSLRTLNGAVATEPLPAGVDVLVIVGRDWDELAAAMKLPPVTEPTEPKAPGRLRPRPQRSPRRPPRRSRRRRRQPSSRWTRIPAVRWSGVPDRRSLTGPEGAGPDRLDT